MINKKICLMKIPSLLVSVLVFILLSTYTAHAAVTISNTKYNAFYVIPAGSYYGQTFTPSQDGNINNIKLLVTCDYRPSPNNEVSVSIYATDDDGLPSIQLATSNSQLVDRQLLFSDKSNEWTTFAFSIPVNVNSGTKYAFVVSSSNFLGIGCNESDIYINGISYSDVYTMGDMIENYGPKWSKSSPATDLSFQIEII